MVGALSGKEFSTVERLAADFRSGRFIPLIPEGLALEVGRARKAVQGIPLTVIQAEQGPTSDAARDLPRIYQAPSVRRYASHCPGQRGRRGRLRELELGARRAFDKIRLFNVANMEHGYTAPARRMLKSTCNRKVES